MEWHPPTCDVLSVGVKPNVRAIFILCLSWVLTSSCETVTAQFLCKCEQELFSKTAIICFVAGMNTVACCCTCEYRLHGASGTVETSTAVHQIPVSSGDITPQWIPRAETLSYYIIQWKCWRFFCFDLFNPLNPEFNPICYLLALLAHHFLHVSRIRVKSLTLRLLMSYI